MCVCFVCISPNPSTCHLLMTSIELRMCGYRPQFKENVAVELIELYVRYELETMYGRL